MPTRRAVLSGLILFAMSGASLAAEQSAQDFLTAIYATYKGKDAKGISLSGRGAVAKYFSPSLARLINADARAAAKRVDLPNLGGDPFIDAQGFEISNFAIDVSERAPGKALGTVKFRNLDKDVTISLDLVKLKERWRIDEIRAPAGSLRALFKKR
jgi:hypothetical protein